MKYRHLKTVFTLLLFTVIISFTFSCGSKEKKVKVTDVNLTDVRNDTIPQPPVPPHTYPAVDSAVTVTVEKKCFENMGMKYLVRVEIDINGTTVTGNIMSKDLGSNQQSAATFTGTLKENNLTIKFAKQAPVVGDASEWTDKPWKLVKNGSKEKLLIPFDAKNYETNKWQTKDYEFEACK